MSSRRIAALPAAAIAAMAIAGIALLGDAQDRQAAVADRGAKVMPFSLDATTHVFTATATGGTQRVVADDACDREQIRLVRGHVRKEAEAFQRGDFADPASVHGETMPGLAALRAGYERFTVRYRDCLPAPPSTTALPTRRSSRPSATGSTRSSAITALTPSPRRTERQRQPATPRLKTGTRRQ